MAEAYTTDCIWRNRDVFLSGRPAITQFLVKKYDREQEYILRKELFAFSDNKIAVQFWYEYRDANTRRYKRSYGIEHWTFNKEGKMTKRQMSANDVELKREERWFTTGVEGVDAVCPRSE